MKRTDILIALFLITGTGCNKNDVDSTLTVEAVDYITGQPIAGAKVKRSWSSDFNLSCLCYQVNTADSLGNTDQNGQLKGLLTFEQIFIEKDGYYTAGEFSYCIHEKNDYFLKFHLLKQSMAKVIVNSSRSFFPEPYVEAGPVLKNGSMLSLSSNGDRLPGILGYANSRPTAGDMQNRILVLKRNDGSSKIDTLFKKEVFIPANTTQEVFVNY